MPKKVSFAFGAEFTRDLLVKLQSITYSTAGSASLLAESIDSFIDSLVSELWLPVKVCNAFQQKFNLTWDGQRHLVSDVAPPCWQKVSEPSGNSSRYFPLKQDHIWTQYDLGRSFLQEACVVTDYERFNFSVPQARFPDTSAKQNLMSIQKAESSQNSAARDRTRAGGMKTAQSLV